jgi:tetratricopeptide (TPR) repeat protein
MVPKTLISFLFLLVLPGAALAVSDAYQSLSMDLVVKAEDDISAARNAEANERLDLALVADPGNARAFVLKGQVQHLLGDTSEGLRLVSIGLQIDPIMREGLVLQTRLASELGNLIVAEAALERFRQICKTNCSEADQLGALVETARGADDGDTPSDSASATIDGE